MQLEPGNAGRLERSEDDDLKRLFRRHAPSFANVDVEAVLKAAKCGSSTAVAADALIARRTDAEAGRELRVESFISSPKTRRRVVMLAKAGILGLCAAGVCVGLVLGLWGGNSVLAEVQNALANVQTATYTVTQSAGDEPAQTWKVSLQGSRRCRAEQPGGAYVVFDVEAKKMMEVNPAEAKVRIIENLPVPENYNILAKLANLKASAAKVQPGVPNREIGGKTATGFLVSDNGVEYKVWIDPATNLPLEMELERREKLADSGGERVIKERWTEFRFDEPLDPSRFAFDAPQGFKVEVRKAPAIDAAEQKRRALAELERAKAIQAGKTKPEEK